MKGDRYIFIFSLCLLFFYFPFWWTHKLSEFPGLHGDEAWVGLEATSYNESGISSLHGMTSYTGILQPYFTSLIFRFSKIGVAELRILGGVMNWLGLLVFCFFWKIKRFKSMYAVLLIILSQSVIFMISPRIAWEVNTFTFFFLAVLFVSTYRLVTLCKPGFNIWTFVFLITSLLGSYNHIIFSCLPLSFFLGLTMWCLFHQSYRYINLVIIGAVNMLNLCILFICMHYFDVCRTEYYIYWLLVASAVLTIEAFAFKQLSERMNTFVFPIKVNKIFIMSILIVGSYFFVYFHGYSFFQLVCNQQVITHFFSYKVSTVLKSLYTIGGSIFIGSIAYSFLSAIRRQEYTIQMFIVCSYIGCFSFYTIECSFRYYLTLFFLLSIYVSFSLSKQIQKYQGFSICMILITIVNTLIFLEIWSNSNKPVLPVYVTMGNGKKETSAHFLSMKPVIDTIMKYQISKIEFMSKRYFLEEPIKFYYKVSPWKMADSTRMFLDYDYDKPGNGYKIETK